MPIDSEGNVTPAICAEFEAVVARMRVMVSRISDCLPPGMRGFIDELRGGGFTIDQIAALTREAVMDLTGEKDAADNLAIAVRAYLAAKP